MGVAIEQQQDIKENANNAYTSVPIGLCAQLEMLMLSVTQADIVTSNESNNVLIEAAASDKESKDLISTIVLSLRHNVNVLRAHLIRIYRVVMQNAFPTDNNAQILLFLCASVLKISPLRDTLFMWSMGSHSLGQADFGGFKQFIA